jgi:hypothetical protein
VLLEQSVHDDHQVAQRTGHDEIEEADAAGGRGVDVRDAFASAEVFRG